jgi:hypothetical protein
MTFHRNPWIDPRVVQMRPEDAKAYLLRHGWKLLGPAANSSLLVFERSREGKDTSAVLLPQQLDDGPMLQRMIDLVADLARFEERWAGAVLHDILQQATAEPVSSNGPSLPTATEPATR